MWSWRNTVDFFDFIWFISCDPNKIKLEFSRWFDDKKFRSNNSSWWIVNLIHDSLVNLVFFECKDIKYAKIKTNKYYKEIWWSANFSQIKFGDGEFRKSSSVNTWKNTRISFQTDNIEESSHPSSKSWSLKERFRFLDAPPGNSKNSWLTRFFDFHSPFPTWNSTPTSIWLAEMDTMRGIIRLNPSLL